MKTCWIAVSLVVLALASPANATLLVHYKFDGNLDEVPSTGSQDNALTAYDSSSAVTPNGSAYVAGVPGLGGQALVLGSTGGSNVQWAGTPDGNDPDLGGLPSTTNWTVETFFQPKALPGSGAFARLALHWGSGDAYHMSIHDLGGNTGPTLNIYTTYGGSGTQHVDSATTLATDAWYYAAAVKSGSTVTLYLNGTSQGSYTVSGDMNNDNNLLFFGSGSADNPFVGFIDDVRIWNEAVDGTYLANRAALLVPEPGSFAMLLIGSIAAFRLVGRKRGQRQAGR